MKETITFCASILTAILLILACNTKELILVTNVELEFSQNTTNTGFVNDLLPATFTITPEAFLPEFEYYIKYEVTEGKGVFLNGDEEELPEGEEILLTKEEEETSFSLPLTYKGLSAGNHRVKVTASDNFDKSIEVNLNYTINNLPVLWTAVGSTNQTLLGTTITATITLENNTGAPNLTFERSYGFSEGTGRLLDASGTVITQNQTVAINPGVSLITIEPTALGTNTITFNLEDSNGQQLNDSITIEVLEEDITPPIISLTGPNPVQITIGDTYTELGATATDNVDGTFPVPASGITGTVDTNTIGEYSISYDASDEAGNAAITVTRAVNVVEENTPDTTPPTITLNGDNPLELTVGATYIEPGATATDNVDGNFDVTDISGTVDAMTIGTYTITYNAQDTAENEATPVTRTVNVTTAPDTTPPTITLNGDNPLELTVGATYIEPGATATDNVDGNFDVTDISGTVDAMTIGTYTITYNAQDTADNQATPVTRTVNVTTAPDTTPPTITLNGDNPLELTVGATYIEPGATATDNVDGNFDVTDISGTVDAMTIGTYTITYNAQDTAENEATPVTRTVNVTTAPDTTPPTITLNGDNPLELTVGATYIEPGATATDNVDGNFDVTDISGTVDAMTIGTYTITYNAIDTADNQATPVTRTVNVTAAPDTTPPTITLNGDNPLELTVGATYIEPGATATDNVDGNFDVTDISGTVDAMTIGTYTITYNAIDTSDNQATPVTRTVNVTAAPDTTPPTITLNGDNPLELTVGATYIEPGATATDNVDGNFDVTDISGTVDAMTIGTYTITYNAIDTAENEATPVTRTVNVTTAPDTTPPTITLNGDNPLELTVGATYIEPGATATDNVDGNFDVPVTGITGTVNTNTVGNYTITYNVSDAAGNSAATVTRTVNIVSAPDTEAPVITLAGPATTEITVGDTYDELGATVTDNVDGTFPIPFTGITGTVDTNTVGNYTITYNVSDAAGNPAATVTRTVNVNPAPNEDPIAVITATPISGTVPLEISFNGTSSSDPDGTIENYFWDFNDDGAASVSINPSYTFNTPGTYQVTLTVTDNDNATNSDTITITVNEALNIPPTAIASASITSGIAPLTVNFDSTGSFDSDGTIGDIVWDFDDNGALTSINNPTYTFTNPGTYVVELTVRDNEDTPGTDTVTIEVAPNNPPVAVNDEYTVNEGESITLDFLANDSDADDDFISMESNTSPSHGVFTTFGPTTLVYRADADSGPVTDSFIYTLSDGNGGTDTATITINILNVNIPPVAVNDEYTVNEGESITLDFLANDSDADNDFISMESNTSPSHGVFTTFGPTTLVYRADADSGPVTDSFIYTLSDGNGGTDTATITINILSVNNPPVASVSSTQVSDSLPYEFDFDSNASDPDGDSLTYSWDFGDGSSATTENPTHAYTETGIFTVTLTVHDGTESVTVTDSVTANTRPTIDIESQQVSDNPPFEMDFDSNASDPDGDSLTYSWDFGDGSSATTENASHSYTTAGTFIVTLTVSDGTQETIDTDTITLTEPVPSFTFSASVTSDYPDVDFRMPINFNINPNSASSGVTYQMKFSILFNTGGNLNGSLRYNSVSNPQNSSFTVSSGSSSGEYQHVNSGYNEDITLEFIVTSSTGVSRTRSVNFCLSSDPNVCF